LTKIPAIHASSSIVSDPATVIGAGWKLQGDTEMVQATEVKMHIRIHFPEMVLDNRVDAADAKERINVPVSLTAPEFQQSSRFGACKQR
jgi:hypothetical protein